MSWRRIVAWSLAFLATMVAGTWFFVQGSDAATHLVRKQLAALFLAPASIERANVELAAGRLIVDGLELTDPGTARPLLRIESLHLDVAADPLGDLVAVHEVVADGVSLVFGPTLPDLGRIVRGGGGGGGAARGQLPSLTLHRGGVRFLLAGDEPPLRLDDLELSLRPIADRDAHYFVAGSARFAEAGATLQLRGELDLATFAARLELTTADVRCDAANLARVRRLFGLADDAFVFDATLRTAQVRLDVAPRPAGAAAPPPTVNAEATFERVRAGIPAVPGIVRTATLTVQATSADGGRATAVLQQQDDRGELTVTTTATQLSGDLQLDARVSGRRLRIDDDVTRALGTFAVGRDVVAALQPTAGLADLELFLRNPQRRGGDTQLDLELRDAAVSFHGFGQNPQRATFPLPMQDARGHIRLRDDLLLLENVEATIPADCGGGRLRLAGRVDTTRAGGDDVSLDIDADDVTFHPALRAALTALLRDDGALYDRLAPHGRTAVGVRVRPRSELRGGWSVSIRPAAASMQWAGFPYRLEQLTGAVTARDAGVDFDLSGQHGSAQLSMQGHIPLSSQQGADDPGFQALVQLRDVAVDDDLRRAVAVLAPEVDEQWRRSEPQGTFHGQVKVWRPTPAAPLQHDAEFDLEGITLRLPVAPWRALDLRGRLLVQGRAGATRLDFDALRGGLDHGGGNAAPLAMLGHLTSGAAAGNDLAFVVRDLALDDQLGATLHQLDALSLDAWHSLAPSGHVDLVCRHRRDAGNDDLTLVVQLTDAGSAAKILPHAAEHITGELRIADGELTFHDLRAQMGGALVQCWDGRVSTRPAPDRRTEIGFAVRATGLPVDDGLANLFSGPLHQAVLDRHLRGRADVDGLRLAFLLPAGDNPLPFETTIGGQLRLYDVDMSLGQGVDGIRVEGISGTATLAESTVTDRGGGLHGTLHGGSLRIFGQPFEAIETAFRADAEQISLRSLTGRFHGGNVRGRQVDQPALTYLLPAPTTPDGRLAGSLDFERVDVFSFLSACGWVNAPYSGTAKGQIELHQLDGNRVVDAEGDGKLTIERADLGVVPLFTQLYAQLPVPDRPRFNHLETRWQMRAGSVRFDQLDVRSDILGANGKGTLDLDGYVDIEMTLNNLLGNSADPIFMPLIEELAKNIVRVHLFGFLRDLRAENRWVTERSPGRRPVTPMPPEAPKPTAPPF
ncbi:MAG: hypothetical protein IT455_06480 [Planctomycetes bacterium]|nr:hypothetical protein [Planctomycetota bacterium]